MLLIYFYQLLQVSQLPYRFAVAAAATPTLSTGTCEIFNIGTPLPRVGGFVHRSYAVATPGVNK